MSAARLRRELNRLLEGHDAAAHRARDPVSFVHAFPSPADREVVGLIASSLAFGNVVAIKRSVARVLDVLGPAPAQAVDALSRAELEARLDGFVHRVWRGAHVAALLANAGALRRAHGSLGAVLAETLSRAPDLREALACFADALRGPDPDRGLAHLVPDPRAGSACKRLLLYLRWMCRPADGVDLGVWPIPASALIIPVDTHVLRIGQNLGLTARRDASWRTAEEITASLRALDAQDPVRYDFAICHLGVSRACPSRRDPEKCRACVVKRVCTHWRADARTT